MTMFSVDVVENEFQNYIKKEADFKVAIEFERLPIDKKSFKQVDYFQKNGIQDLLRSFATQYGWDYIVDDYNIIGLSKGNDTVTLEPGCQLEVSFTPEKSISEIKSKLDNFNKKINPILEKSNIKLLEYGISPVSTYRNINLLPKRRYALMANYLWGILSDVMMRETAGIQASFDFSSEDDAIRKFRLANIISPFATAMCANSPIRGGVDTGYKTFRALSWLNTDNERCNFMSKKLFENYKNYSFKDYIDDVLSVPMIFIFRNDDIVNINGKIDFKTFMKCGYEGFEPTMEDFKLQANLYFPDVRLRNFIEIRNHDCSNHGMQYSIPAFYKGILYNKGALKAAEKLLSKFTYNQLKEFRYLVVKNALATKIGKYYAKDIAKELLLISENSLKAENNNEHQFLAPMLELVNQGLCPADVILKNWNGCWMKDVNKLINYLSN
ncbi:MAG: glutamate-cysteine ligase family protein [bacterium]|nr:glutamate-cysteine ligase family protein [bacterium]